MNAGPVLVVDQVLSEANSVALEEQDHGTASGTKQRLWRARAQDHPFLDRPRILVAMFAVALLNLSDHERDHLDHGNASDGRAVGTVGVENGHHPTVLGKRRQQLHRRVGIAGVVAALYREEMSSTRPETGLCV